MGCVCVCMCLSMSGEILYLSVTLVGLDLLEICLPLPPSTGHKGTCPTPTSAGSSFCLLPSALYSLILSDITAVVISVQFCDQQMLFFRASSLRFAFWFEWFVIFVRCLTPQDPHSHPQCSRTLCLRHSR